jgi:HAD superfamily hydrolase (TIGR01509 family)
MAIRAVFFDFGGVIMRTEYQAPRQHLAERFDMEYEEIERIVFNSETALRASVGEIPEEQHWAGVMSRLRLPVSEAASFRDAFFGGDVIDRELVNFIRSLRGRFHTGLISNAWSGLREFLGRQSILDAFETVIISAEVEVAKPEARIFAIALERAGVRAQEALFVDDVRENIQACEEAGLRGLLFRDPAQARAELNHLLPAE